MTRYLVVVIDDDGDKGIKDLNVIDEVLSQIAVVIDPQQKNAVSLNITKTNAMTNTSSVTSHLLPIASSTVGGLMPYEAYQTLEGLQEKVESLNGVVRYLNGKNFGTDNLTTLQTLLTQEAINQGYEEPLPNALIINNWFNDSEYIYNADKEEWIEYGNAAVALATNTTAGIMQGATADGKVFIETDGTGSVVGWDPLKTRVTSIETNHVANTSNPHSVTKAQVGLGSADNTADANKSVASAAKWTTTRTIGTSGDVTSTAQSIDGSANVTIPLTLASVATAGSTGPTGNTTLTYGGTFVIPQITINVKGLTTSVTGRTMTMPEAPTSAATLTTPRTFTLSGDVTSTAQSFNGAANVTIPATLATVATAGSTGPTGNSTLTYGGTFIIPQITINAKGLTTSVTGRTITMPAAPTTVTGNAGTATKLATAKTIGTSGGATGTAQSFDGSGNITIPITALAASYLSGAIPSAVTATTQSSSDNSTKIATTAYVQSRQGIYTTEASAKTASQAGDTTKVCYFPDG
jgi:hypothetical protein